MIAASLVLLALLAGVTGTTWGLFEARRSAEAKAWPSSRPREEDPGRGELKEGPGGRRGGEEGEGDGRGGARLRREQVFAAARPKDQAGGMGYDVKLADAVTAALPSIEKDFPDKPLTEARLRQTIGSPSLPGKAGDRGGAIRGGSVTLYRRERGPDHPDTLRSMLILANSYHDLGRHAEALKLREETLALMKAKLGPDHPDTLRSMNNLGQQLRRPRPARRGRQAQRRDAGPDEGQARPRSPRDAREHDATWPTATALSAGAPRPSSSTKRRWP